MTTLQPRQALSSIGAAMHSSFLGTAARVYRSKRDARNKRARRVPCNLHGRIVYYCICSASITISGSARAYDRNYLIIAACLWFMCTLFEIAPITRDLEILVTTTHLIATHERYPARTFMRVVQVSIEKRDETRSNPRGEFYETDFTHLVDFALLYSFYAAGRELPRTLVRVLLKAHSHMRRKGRRKARGVAARNWL